MNKVRARRGLFYRIFLGLLICFSIAARADSLQIDVLDVGQGECILITAGGERLLYDGGPRETSSYVVSRLEHMGVDYLDYMISSHYDEDHLAGLIGVLHKIPVGVVLASDYEPDTAIYSSFESVLSEKQISPVTPVRGEEYPFGSYSIQIIGPEASEEESATENDRSLAVRVTNGTEALLICGDAQTQEEQDMLANNDMLAAAIYIVNHHGSNSSSGEAFLAAVSPGLSVISCGKDNEYGHPHQEVLDRLEQAGSTVLRTDQLGELQIVTDGSGGMQITADASSRQENSSRQKKEEEPSADIGNEQAEEQGDAPAGGYTYVCNKNTMVFHFPGCASVHQMSEKNKEYSELSREELEEAGYRPCKNCEP